MCRTSGYTVRIHFLPWQRLCTLPCKPSKVILKPHVGKKGAFAKSLLLTNGLCTVTHLQENPTSYSVIDDPFVLSFCPFLHHRRTSQYLLWIFGVNAGTMDTLCKAVEA